MWIYWRVIIFQYYYYWEVLGPVYVVCSWALHSGLTAAGFMRKDGQTYHFSTLKQLATDLEVPSQNGVNFCRFDSDSKAESTCFCYQLSAIGIANMPACCQQVTPTEHNGGCKRPAEDFHGRFALLPTFWLWNWGERVGGLLYARGDQFQLSVLLVASCFIHQCSHKKTMFFFW